MFPRVRSGDLASDARLALRLIVRHEAAFSRSAFEKFLEPDERPVAERLLDG